MHTIINIIRQGMLCLLPLFALTACSGKEEIVLSQDGRQETWETEGIPGASVEAEETASQRDIYVHICGAVVNPGVYALAADSRIFEGIEAAGGFREDACEDYVNLAKTLQDGQRLIIPTLEEVEAAGENDPYHKRWMAEDADAADSGEGIQSAAAGQSAAAIEDGLVNINLATESELSSINGIGAGKAAAIVKYRQEIGGFSSIEEIMEVSGIGKGIYEKIKDKITVR